MADEAKTTIQTRDDRIRRDALEEAAALLDRDAAAAQARWEMHGDRFGIGFRHVATLRQYATAIRSLANKEPAP